MKDIYKVISDYKYFITDGSNPEKKKKKNLRSLNLWKIRMCLESENLKNDFEIYKHITMHFIAGRRKRSVEIVKKKKNTK